MERKRREQGGVMWTEYHKRSDANHIGWINLIQSNTTHCAKLGLMRVQEGDIDTFTSQVAAPGLFGGFSFHGLKKLEVGDSWNHCTAQSKEHSKTEFEKREFWEKFEESETFSRSKFSPATGVICWKWRLIEKSSKNPKKSCQMMCSGAASLQ